VSSSARTRSRPMILTSSSTDLSVSNTVTSIHLAPGRPVNLVRLVTITGQAAVPGSSGDTWRSLLAPSSITSSRFSASMLRYSSARSRTSAGTAVPATPSARRKRASTFAACSSASSPCRSA
jgi:hypothetical protein